MENVIMTNFEKYQEQILKVAKEQQSSVAFANNQIFSCQDISCSSCNFNSTTSCTSSFIEWLYKEYKEQPLELTQKQRYFFLSIEDQVWRIKREINDYGNIVYKLQTQSGQIKIIPTFIFSCDILELNKWYKIEELLQWPIKDEEK